MKFTTHCPSARSASLASALAVSLTAVLCCFVLFGCTAEGPDAGTDSETVLSGSETLPSAESRAETDSEAAAETATEAVTETVTEIVTEAEPTDSPATEADTEPTTAYVTEPVTEPETVPVTEPDTMPVTEPVTEPETEPPHVHSFGAWETVTPSDCVTAGTEQRFCGCGECEERSLPLAAHTGIQSGGRAPTCTEPGNSGVTVCRICGITLIEAETLPATGHTEVQDSAVAPDCTNSGLTAGVHCAVCGVVLKAQEVVPATGHTEVQDSAVAPVCTESGLTAGVHCAVCGAVLKAQEIVPATGHTEVQDSAAAPDCTNSGLTAGVHCAVCGVVLKAQEIVPATGHTVVIDEAVWSTDTETGLYEGSHCSVCGEVLVKQEVMPLYDPAPLSLSELEGILIAKVYGTGKKNTDAAAEHGFVQLYNSTDRDISLEGAALYYQSKLGDGYKKFLFPRGAVIPAHGYYLVRAKSPNDYSEDYAVLSVKYYDAKFDTYIDNKEIRLIFGPNGMELDPDAEVTAVSGAADRFLASEDKNNAVFAVTDMSKNKVAVRTALTAYSGFHKVNLTRAGMDELNSIRLVNSLGEVSRVKHCYVDEILFSHDAGVYEDAFNLSLTGPEGWDIWITTDGSDPATSATRKRYTDPVLLSDSSAMAWGPTTKLWTSVNWAAVPSAETMPGGYVIKAYATDGESSTAVYTNTYFITDLTQYGVKIISMSMPAEDMVGGSGWYSNYCPSGYITAERPRGVACFEMFDRDGDRVGYSNVELAVSGNGSSGLRMKSMRIYFKGSLNEGAGLQSDLDCDVFDGLARDVNGNAITSFSRLLLRNSGNDCGHSYIRDAYMQRVAAGLKVDSMASVTTLVFINGEFWGVYNLRERYSPEYIESHYGIDKDNVAMVESDYAALVYQGSTTAPYLLMAGEQSDADDFNALSDYIISKDMSKSKYYDYVTERMDIDSFIDLWVLRLFFNARDWPENNMKVWKNKNPDDPSGFDTKWHFTLLDTDMGFSYFVGANDTSEKSNYFYFVNSGSRCAQMMKKLLKNASFREKFICRYYEVTTVDFSAEKLSAILEPMLAERDVLMPLQAARWPHDGASVATWNNQKPIMRQFVQNRQAYALKFLYSSKTYTLLSESQIKEIIARNFG